MEDDIDSGLKNLVFCENGILEKGLKIITKDYAGKHCRRIHFFPHTGRLQKYPLRRKEDREKLFAREKAYMEDVSSGL
jgi:chemotaxis receptor (MCP) glutamine deamidase CheD